MSAYGNCDICGFPLNPDGDCGTALSHNFTGPDRPLSNSELHPDYPNVEVSYCESCGRPVFKYPDFTLEIIDSVTESDVEHDCSTYSER